MTWDQISFVFFHYFMPIAMFSIARSIWREGAKTRRDRVSLVVFVVLGVWGAIDAVRLLIRGQPFGDG